MKKKSPSLLDGIEIDPVHIDVARERDRFRQELFSIIRSFSREPSRDNEAFIRCCNRMKAAIEKCTIPSDYAGLFRQKPVGVAFEAALQLKRTAGNPGAPGRGAHLKPFLEEIRTQLKQEGNGRVTYADIAARFSREFPIAEPVSSEQVRKILTRK